MKTGDLAKQFGVDSKTITRWTGEFADYLSDGARKVGTHQRVFNAEDFKVLATVHQLSADGHSFKDIHQRIADGYRIDDPAMATVGYQDGRMVPAAVVNQIAELSELRATMARIETERDRLLTENAEQKERIKELTDQIGDLREQLGELRGELNYRRQQDKQSDD